MPNSSFIASNFRQNTRRSTFYVKRSSITVYLSLVFITDLTARRAQGAWKCEEKQHVSRTRWELFLLSSGRTRKRHERRKKSFFFMFRAIKNNFFSVGNFVGGRVGNEPSVSLLVRRAMAGQLVIETRWLFLESIAALTNVYGTIARMSWVASLEWNLWCFRHKCRGMSSPEKAEAKDMRTRCDHFGLRDS